MLAMCLSYVILVAWAVRVHTVATLDDVWRLARLSPLVIVGAIVAEECGVALGLPCCGLAAAVLAWDWVNNPS